MRAPALRARMLGGLLAGVFGAFAGGQVSAGAALQARSRPVARASRAPHDPRIRYVRYESGRVYRLRGYAGYEIDLQFAPGERFVGLGVGDAKAVKIAAAANHLFIKPLAAHIATDMTVLTNRRAYVFNYRVRSSGAPARGAQIVYAVRFEYSPPLRQDAPAHRQRRRVRQDLHRAEQAPPLNEDYWFCGPRALQPQAAWDDGAETHLIFPSREPLPAVFVRNADGSDSLVNFDMRGEQMVIHRIAHRFVLKRGRLTGCIVNEAFAGSGRRLASGTISRRVARLTLRRATRRAAHPGGSP